MIVLNKKLVFLSKQEKYKLFVKNLSYPKGVIDVETSESGRVARLQTLASEQFAIVDTETSQLCAIGEQYSEVGVTHFVAVRENERFEIAAAFSQLEQAPTAHFHIAML